jgi:hypothetical protein
VEVTSDGRPTQATGWSWNGRAEALPIPVDVDAGLSAPRAAIRIEVRAGERALPWLTEASMAGGRLLVLNIRTFSEADFRASGEWLLAPEHGSWRAAPGLGE